MPFRIVEISSPRNPLIQSVRLAASRGRATEDGLHVAEGPHLLDELLKSQRPVARVLLTPPQLTSWKSRLFDADTEIVVVPERIMAVAGATEAPQGVIALFHPRTWEWEDFRGSPSLIVVLDRIQDPGNAGTIIRSAEAFGATGIVLLPESVRISNGKLMRASAGSLFRMPVLEAPNMDDLLTYLKKADVSLLVLDASATASVSDVDWSQPCALVVGNEGSGVSQALLARSTSIAIPAARVESLNAAVACSVALYEASHQRGMHEPV